MNGQGCPNPSPRQRLSPPRASAFGSTARLALIIWLAWGTNHLTQAAQLNPLPSRPSPLRSQPVQSDVQWGQAAVARVAANPNPSSPSTNPSSAAADFPAVTNPNADPSPAPQRELKTMRLRFSWGGGKAQTWIGSIAIVDGEFSQLAPLSLTADAPVAVRQVDQEVRIKHWQPANYSGTDVTITALPTSQITWTLTSVENPNSSFQRTFAFADLLQSNVGGLVDNFGNRCSATRAPGDMLVVNLPRDHLVYQAGEQFRCELHPNLTGITSRKAKCKIRLVQSQAQGPKAISSFVSDFVVFELDESGSAQASPIEFRLPLTEGVYDLEFELEPIWYQPSFQARNRTVKRTVQLLVLAERSPQTEKAVQAKMAGETILDRIIRPGESRRQGWRQISTAAPFDSSNGWGQLPSQLSRLGPPAPIGNELRKPVVIDQQSYMQLEPGGWQVVPLSIDRIDRPHVIEIDYVAQGELALGVSLLEPDASGQIPMNGFDSGVFVPPKVVGDSARVVRQHRLTVWPKTKSPHLLLANRHAQAGAVIGSVRVFAGPDYLEPSELSLSAPAGRRKLMAFYETPLFPDNFGAREFADPEIEQPLDDWQMFYDGASRFIEYLKANSYRGAFISVASDGSTIYPSQLLSPSPTQDTGIFFDNGQDPLRKDVLEMLFRMFDREGLILVPTLSLASPIPSLENIRRVDRASGFELVDASRNTRELTLSGTLPIYNPLDRDLQRVVTAIVEEVAERYQHHSAYEGLSLVCRPDTCTLLPGQQWGYDETSIEQFFQAYPELGDPPTQWGELQSLLLGSHRPQWLKWRADRMTRWYREIAERLQRGLAKSKLYLAPVDLYQHAEISSALSPSLHLTSDFEQLMEQLGLTTELFSPTTFTPDAATQQQPSSIVLLSPHRIAPDKSLAQQRVDVNAETSKQAKQFFAKADYAADLFTHRVSWAHFAQLQSRGLFGPQDTPLMRLQQMTPAAQFNRMRFVQAIKDRDARLLVDGGWSLAMGQESATLDLMQVFGQLPDERFETVAAEGNEAEDWDSLPLAIRKLNTEEGSYFYIANASPWPIDVDLDVRRIQTGAEPLLESLSSAVFTIHTATRSASPVSTSRNPTSRVRTDDPASSERRSNSGQSAMRISVHVPAYGLVGGFSADPNLELGSFKFQLPDDADKKLRKRIYGLQAKLIRSGNSLPLSVLPNPDFEIEREQSLAGWDRGKQTDQQVQIVYKSDGTATSSDAFKSTQATGKPSGNCLRLENENASAVWVRSEPFGSPDTGRLSISVWLRSDTPAAQPALRLAVDGQSATGSYYRFGTVGALSQDPSQNQIERHWKRFAVHFDDLPLDRLEEIRIGFDLIGAGQVDVDGVQVFDRWFDENDAKVITQILASTGPLLARAESFDRCRRLLDGYWLRFLHEHVSSDDLGTRGEEDSAVQLSRTPESSPTSSSDSATRPALASEPRPAFTPESSEGFDNRKTPLFRRFRSLRK